MGMKNSNKSTQHQRKSKIRKEKETRSDVASQVAGWSFLWKLETFFVVDEETTRRGSANERKCKTSTCTIFRVYKIIWVMGI
jgi:hypothetical protein